MLKDGKTAVGTTITEFRSPEVARMTAHAGFDLIFTDTERSSFNLEMVTNIVRVGKAVGLN